MTADDLSFHVTTDMSVYRDEEDTEPLRAFLRSLNEDFR